MKNLFNNVVNLDRSVIILSNLVRDNGYDVGREFYQGKVKFSLSGGKGIDNLSDLIWEAEQGKNEVDFEVVPFYDHNIDILKNLNVYSSKNFIVEYLSENFIDD